MASKRVLVFGGNGQVGQALRHAKLPTEWQLNMCSRTECDLGHPGAIGRIFQTFEPDIVINAAAMTDIDICEKNKDLAMRINFESVSTLAAHCAHLNAPLIQISTDYVFDGTEGDVLYQPDDPMNPINVYGQSKMMGEEAARHGLHWHVILRTSLIFSAYANNALTKTLRQIDTQDEIQIVTDQKGNPTSAKAVADALITISDAILKGKVDGFGTFHVSGEPAVSRFEFAQAIVDAYTPHTSRRPKLIPVRSADMVGRVPRPANSSLNNDKAKRIYGIAPRSWRDDLAVSIKSLMESRAA